MEVMKNQNFSQEAPRHGQFSSIFSQLLKIFSRFVFVCVVKKHKADWAAGRSLLPCFSAKSGELTACGRFAEA